jgi:hypothetical protein
VVKVVDFGLAKDVPRQVPLELHRAASMTHPSPVAVSRTSVAAPLRNRPSPVSRSSGHGGSPGRGESRRVLSFQGRSG